MNECPTLALDSNGDGRLNTVLEKMGALKELQEGIAGLGNSSLAALITSYVVAIVSAFASTTGTLGVISPVVAPVEVAGGRGSGIEISAHGARLSGSEGYAIDDQL